MNSIQSLDATELASAIRDGQLSPREAVQSAITEIERLNPSINALVSERFDDALKEAESDLPDGPLVGVPFAVKAIGASLAGMPITRGSRLWADDIAQADSELVRRYRAAGMIPVGMSNTPELGKSPSTEPALHGPTRNPWDKDRSAGGSSGGAAAAVSSGMLAVAHATDGGGSIRIPAAATGLVGLKPSRGRISTYPNPTLMSGAVVAHHVVTRTVRDSALLLEVGAGSRKGDAFSIGGATDFVRQAASEPSPRSLRVGLITSLINGPDTDQECVDAARRAAVLCEKLGHTVVEIDAPWDTGRVQKANGMLQGVSMGNEVRDRLAVLGRDLRQDDLEPFTRFLLERYRTISSSDIGDALQTSQRVGWEMGAALDDVDLLLTPMMCIRTPELGYMDTLDPAAMVERSPAMAGWTGVFNLTGLPAISVPHGVDSNGMPVGVQFGAGPGEEGLLLSIAGQFERAEPWPLMAPTIG